MQVASVSSSTPSITMASYTAEDLAKPIADGDEKADSVAAGPAQMKNRQPRRLPGHVLSTQLPVGSGLPQENERANSKRPTMPRRISKAQRNPSRSSPRLAPAASVDNSVFDATGDVDSGSFQTKGHSEVRVNRCKRSDLAICFDRRWKLT